MHIRNKNELDTCSTFCIEINFFGTQTASQCMITENYKKEEKNDQTSHIVFCSLRFSEGHLNRHGVYDG